MSGNIVVISGATLPAVQSVNGQTGNIQLQLSGDVSSPVGSFITTLATVNSNTGSFGDASHTITLTIDGKGRVTAASANSIAIAATQITSGTLPTAAAPALTGDVTNTAGSLATTVVKINGVALGSTTATAGNLLVGSGSQWVSVPASGDLSLVSSGAYTLATVNTNTGSWGTASSVPNFTVNGKGLITAAANVSIAIAGSQITSGAINNIPVGNTTPSTGAFTTISASSTVSGSGFSTYFASPPAIGGTVAAAGSFTTLSATGNFTPSQTNGIVGTTTNNNANAGSIGEYVSNSTTSVNLTASGSTYNVTSISLTAGDWDVSGVIQIVGSAAVLTVVQAGATSTSGALGALGSWFLYSGPAANQIAQAIPICRFSLAATTTIYAVASATFTGTATANAFIRARRVR